MFRNMFEKSTSEVPHVCGRICVAPRSRSPQHHFTSDASLWEALQCCGNFLRSIFLLNVGAVHPRRWEEALRGIFALCVTPVALAVLSSKRLTKSRILSAAL